MSLKGVSALLLTVACFAAAAFFFTQFERESSSTRALLKDHRDWNHFNAWMFAHGKIYETEDTLLQRFGIFLANKAFINANNNQGYNFTYGLNQFADLTMEEFRAMHLCNLLAPSDDITYTDFEKYKMDAEVDWSKRGIVQEVKNQGSCGSCWAFSTVAAVESAYAQKNGKLLSLSEQQLVDCSKAEGNQGCNGGLMDYGFTYLKTHSLESESDYPYKAVDGTCAYDESKGVTKVTSFTDVAKNEAALKKASSERVVSVAVDAQWWQFYSGGVFDLFCGSSLDHGVTLVGYGTDNGKMFWKIKNSWGASWGEKGYIRIKRTESTSSTGFCAVAASASYPTL